MDLKLNNYFQFVFVFHLLENGDQRRSSDKSIGKIDSSTIRETPPRTIKNESNREYKHVTDFTGPTVTHTTKVRIYLTCVFFFFK